MYCIMYDVLSQISYLANAWTIIREGESSNCKSQIYFYKVLKVSKDSRDSSDIFFIT